jgi:hypothetical protein
VFADRAVAGRSQSRLISSSMTCMIGNSTPFGIYTMSTCSRTTAAAVHGLLSCPAGTAHDMTSTNAASIALRACTVLAGVWGSPSYNRRCAASRPGRWRCRVRVWLGPRHRC